MFGSNNQQPNDQIPDHSIDGALQDDTAAAQVPAQPDPAVPQPAQPAPAVVQPASDAQNSWGHPGVPLDAQQTEQVQAGAAPAEIQQPAQESNGHVSDELIDIKQKALTQLSPLVGHLEQTPEEKFRTTMMMIQASDDQSLIPQAYEAANAITDEKAKAQALLDIVNEINYFTSHQHNQG